MENPAVITTASITQTVGSLDVGEAGVAYQFSATTVTYIPLRGYFSLKVPSAITVNEG